MLALLCTTLGVLLVLAAPVVAVERFVATTGTDTGGCTNSAAPCRHITYGISQMASNDILTIGNGLYDEMIADIGANPGYVNAPIPSGSGGNFTILRAANIGQVTVRAQRNGGDNGMIVIMQTGARNHVKFQGLVFDAENLAGGIHYCITTDFVSDIHFEDVECKNADNGWVGTGQNIVFTRVWFHHIGGGRNGGSFCIAGEPDEPGFCHAFYSQPIIVGESDCTTPATNNGPIIIQDSLLEDVNGYGVQNYMRGLDVRRTIVRNTYSGGILVSGPCGGAAQVYSNLIANTGNFDGVGGISVAGGSTIIGNTIVNSPGAGVSIERKGGTTVKNNLIVNGADERIRNSGSGPTNNNICDVGGSDGCDIVNTSPATAFFTAPGSGDYTTLATSPARNAGVNLGSPYNLDVSRPPIDRGSVWDIGAYEYGVVVAPYAASLQWVVASFDPVAAGEVFGVSVRVLDQLGAVFTGSSVSVELHVLPNPGGAVLSGTNPKGSNAGTGIVSFDDLSMSAPGTNYILRAQSTGLTSADSPPLTVSGTFVIGVPTALRIVTTTVSGTGSITMEWNFAQATIDATGFRVYRQDSCTGSFVIRPGMPLALATTLYSDSGLTIGQSYCWRVHAIDATAAEGAGSNVLEWTVAAVTGTSVHVRPGSTGFFLSR